MDKVVPYHLITGFLGSGKTTFLNHLVTHMHQRRIGLLLNDFGPIVVDSALAHNPQQFVQVRTLKGGQIFCACLAPSFIQQVVDLANLDLDLIVVETSGLAKPTALADMTRYIDQRSAYKARFGSMICVVDAARFIQLSQVVSNVEEQVTYSDAIILNKVDLVGDDTLRHVLNRLHELAPGAPVFPCRDGKAAPSVLSIHSQRASRQDGSYAGWGEYGRPQSAVFLPVGSFDQDSLAAFLKDMASWLLRAKGFVHSPDGSLLEVDAVGDQVRICRRDAPVGIEEGLVLIYRASVGLDRVIKTAWRDRFGVEGRLVETQGGGKV